ncbi:MbnP family protein [Pontibacter sp. MBLB2868]|uniref:MbnP family protein n=1 Tax=Pontibacter sp. MBLB2868 TaxID=3451555 RepID=UPI003F751A3B
MRNFSFKIVLLWLAAFSLSACSKDDNKATPGEVEVEIKNMVGTSPLQLNGTIYTSPAGDTYAVSNLKYYISNVKLISQYGQFVYVEPESYHLVAQDGSMSFVLQEVPMGMYNKIELAIGVDQAHNHSTDQEGDLDPGNEMVWDWDTGYKFLSLVGNFEGDTKNGNLVFHVGGDQNFKTITLALPQVIDLREKSNYKINMQADVNGLFQDPNLIDFDVMSSGGHGAGPSKIAENYSSGFLNVTQVQ